MDANWRNRCRKFGVLHVIHGDENFSLKLDWNADLCLMCTSAIKQNSISFYMRTKSSAVSFE